MSADPLVLTWSSPEQPDVVAIEPYCEEVVGADGGCESRLIEGVDPEPSLHCGGSPSADSYSPQGLVPGRLYAFALANMDGTGNISVASNVVCAVARSSRVEGRVPVNTPSSEGCACRTFPQQGRSALSTASAWLFALSLYALERRRKRRRTITTREHARQAWRAEAKGEEQERRNHIAMM